MTMPLDKQSIIDVDLKQQIEKLDWSRWLDYGIITIQVHKGKPVLVRVERTLKCD